VAVLDRATMAQMLGSEAYCGGWIDRRGGSIQPLAFARGLAAAAIGKGAVIHGGAPAQTIRREEREWRIETPGGSVLAGAVLLCTNGYTDKLFAGLEREVISTNSYQAATRPLPERIRATILPGGHNASDSRRVLLYYRLDRDGRFVIGGRGTAVDEPQPALFERLRVAARDIYPQLGEAEWGNHWAGRVAFTSDHLPHLAELGPGLLAGLGYQGRGVAMATNIGKLLADRLLGAGPEELPLPIVQGLRPFPCHFLRVPALYAVSRWYRLLDMVG
jgi:glycine/D-amino acid oxidase-like deaminating enzyme